MKVRSLIIAIITIFSANGLFAQVSTNQKSDENVYTIQQTRVSSFENQIKAYFGNQNSRLFVENQTKEAVTVQIVTMDGKLSFLTATEDRLVSIPLKELSGKGIFILQVFDIHGNYYSKRLLVY
ncbi:MAG: T9SS type A sorting domain-containing protein [Bacteroidales bacterium]|nr:T9SS type A sorting domain-containing protein [Bacteroidales bacterium]